MSLPNASLGGRRATLRIVLAATLGSALALIAAANASAARPLETGFSEGRYVSNSASVRDEWFNLTDETGAGIVRLNLGWRNITSGEPADPRDPADPAYNFARFDAAVRDAAARGLDVLITSYHAPDFAEGANRPGNVRAGTWRPNASDYKDFSIALAERYSGSFNPPGAGGVLPRVRYYQAWNETNLPAYITPQFDGNTPVSPGIYRDLLNAFYDGVKSVRSDNFVVGAGTAPYGDQKGGNRMRPLLFWRKVLCIKKKRKKSGKVKLKKACDDRTQLDAIAHHPINTSGGPKQSAISADDASTPDLHHVVKILRKAEKKGNVPGGRHPLWATEFWWESNPPDRFVGVPEGRHARWIQQALYLIWKQKGQVAILLQAGDSPYDSSDPLATFQSGIFFENGNKKRAFQAFRFPFVTERKSRKKVKAWGKAPVAGKVKIQRKKGGGWRTVKKKRVGAGDTFKKKLKLRGKARLRAKIGSEKSLTWKQGRGGGRRG